MYKDSSGYSRKQLIGMVSYLRGFLTTTLIEIESLRSGEDTDFKNLELEAKWLLKNTSFDLAQCDATSDGFYDKSWLDFNRR